MSESPKSNSGSAQKPPTAPRPSITLQQRIKRLACVVGIGLGLGYLLLLLAVLFFESSFIYFPSKYPNGDWDAPVRNREPQIEDVFLDTPDGVKIHGWHMKTPAAKTTLLYFHGNAGNITGRYYWLTQLVTLGVDVFIIDYRGYGRSEGESTENGLYTDGLAAYDYLTQTCKIAPENLVIYGNSLGGAVAAHVASKKPCKGLIMQSSFTSAKDMARRMFGWMPLHFFISSNFDNLNTIKSVTVPKLILHGRRDHLIPSSMGERLYEAANEPKQLVLIDKLGHNDFASVHAKDVLKAFEDMLR